LGKALSAKHFQGLPPVALPLQASMPLSQCLAAAPIPAAKKGKLRNENEILTTV